MTKIKPITNFEGDAKQGDLVRILYNGGGFLETAGYLVSISKEENLFQSEHTIILSSFSLGSNNRQSLTYYTRGRDNPFIKGYEILRRADPSIFAEDPDLID